MASTSSHYGVAHTVYNEQHWVEVKNILCEALENTEFNVEIVSNSDESGIIQKRIVENIYSNDIIICDISGKNPNVMFELGMRLAFDKPTIVIKDDKTGYSFDTSPIEHLNYPSNLNYHSIVVFEEKLCEKVIATHKAAKEDKEYSTFLKSFGTFTVATIETKEVSKEDYILEEIAEIKKYLYSNDFKDKKTFSENHSVDKDIILGKRNSILRMLTGTIISDNPNLSFDELLQEIIKHPEVINISEKSSLSPAMFKRVIRNILNELLKNNSGDIS